MPALYEIIFSDRPDEPVKWSAFKVFFYRYPDEDSEFRVSVTVGWCEVCEGLAAVEWLKDPEKLRTDYSRLCDRSSDEVKELLVFNAKMSASMGLPASTEQDEDYYATQLENARLDLAFREARRSLPRCLHCGTTRIFISDDNGLMAVPGGDTAKVSIVGMNSGRFPMFFYDSEGRKLLEPE